MSLCKFLLIHLHLGLPLPPALQQDMTLPASSNMRACFHEPAPHLHDGLPLQQNIILPASSTMQACLHCYAYRQTGDSSTN